MFCQNEATIHKMVRKKESKRNLNFQTSTKKFFHSLNDHFTLQTAIYKFEPVLGQVSHVTNTGYPRANLRGSMVGKLCGL